MPKEERHEQESISEEELIEPALEARLKHWRMNGKASMGTRNIRIY